MFELLGASKPMYVLELPQRAQAPEALAYWTNQVLKLKEYLEKRFNTRITDEKLREAIRLMNRERRLRLALAESMMRAEPPLTGRQLLELKSTISGIPADLEQYEKALQVLAEHTGAGASPACCSSATRGRGGRAPVRVLLTGVPLVHGAERVLELIESCGAVVVAMENCTGLKPILENVDEADPDPLAAIARKYYHLPCSVMTPNGKRLQSLRELSAKFRPDCIIELVWHACLTYDIESYQVRKLAEEELRLPYLKITTDYSPSDSARILARVEALIETARVRSGTA
jgi:benzoyl-CoA reductase/2-hydroxyglutaryl-CoA dehydratase subunit BcrC/BadD/HgdB